MRTLFEQLRAHEGWERFPYVDTVGKVTIGCGRNLTDKGLSDDEIEYLLANDLRECRADLETFPWFHDLDEPRKDVLMNMRFNLGAAGLRKFRNTLRMVESGDYEGAALGMLHSKWASQVKGRAVELAAQMRTGRWA